MLRDANAISIATDHNSHTLKRFLAKDTRTDHTIKTKLQTTHDKIVK
jgi:hypothetical protein